MLQINGNPAIQYLHVFHVLIQWAKHAAFAWWKMPICITCEEANFNTWEPMEVTNWTSHWQCKNAAFRSASCHLCDPHRANGLNLIARKLGSQQQPFLSALFFDWESFAFLCRFRHWILHVSLLRGVSWTIIKRKEWFARLTQPKNHRWWPIVGPRRELWADELRNSAASTK